MKDKLLLIRLLSFLIDGTVSLIPSILLLGFIISVFDKNTDFGLALFTSVFMYIMPFNIITNIPFIHSFLLLGGATSSFVFVYVIYCFFCEQVFGYTIGQKKFNIIYINYSGDRINRKQSLIRNICKLLLLSIYGLGLLSIIFSKSHRPLYDILTKTYIKVASS